MRYYAPSYAMLLPDSRRSCASLTTAWACFAPRPFICLTSVTRFRGLSPLSCHYNGEKKWLKTRPLSCSLSPIVIDDVTPTGYANCYTQTTIYPCPKATSRARVIRGKLTFKTPIIELMVPDEVILYIRLVKAS
jgi:hypothetical protein